ncbi:MAG: hypothetical protein ACK4GL_02685 [Flavobacteriales bacterium]
MQNTLEKLNILEARVKKIINLQAKLIEEIRSLNSENQQYKLKINEQQNIISQLEVRVKQAESESKQEQHEELRRNLDKLIEDLEDCITQIK